MLHSLLSNNSTANRSKYVVEFGAKARIPLFPTAVDLL